MHNYSWRQPGNFPSFQIHQMCVKVFCLPLLFCQHCIVACFNYQLLFLWCCILHTLSSHKLVTILLLELLHCCLLKLPAFCFMVLLSCALCPLHLAPCILRLAASLSRSHCCNSGGFWPLWVLRNFSHLCQVKSIKDAIFSYTRCFHWYQIPLARMDIHLYSLPFELQ